MKQVRYCWLSPSHTFSNSWSQSQHDRIFTEKEIEDAAKKGWRIIRYQVLSGDDFEFPNQSHLAHTEKGNIKIKK